MSDTPRTDAAEVYYSEIVTGRDAGLYWVKADFARDLERELAEKNSPVWDLNCAKCISEKIDDPRSVGMQHTCAKSEKTFGDEMRAKGFAEAPPKRDRCRCGLREGARGTCTECGHSIS